MANNNGTFITANELKNVLSSLKRQRETIKTTYNSMIKNVLESSSSCFSVAGLDYESIISSFDSTFTSLDSNLGALIDVLENNVIKTYSELVIAIRQMFGTDFANRMSQLIGLNK